MTTRHGLKTVLGRAGRPRITGQPRTLQEARRRTWEGLTPVCRLYAALSAKALAYPTDAAIAGADAVVVTVGAPSDARAPVRTPVTAAVIEAMRNAGVRRLVVQSSLGVGGSIRRLDPVTRYVVFPFVLKHAMADHDAQEDLVRTSGLDWTILRPGYLNDQPATGRLIAIATDDPRRFSSKVSRQDVARYALDVVSDTSSIGRELLLVTPR